MRAASCLALVAMLVGSSGCYLGRSSDRKAANYMINGTGLFVGLIMLGVGASKQQPPCDMEFSECISDPIQKETAGIISAVLLAASSLGLGINIVVPTKDPPPNR